MGKMYPESCRHLQAPGILSVDSYRYTPCASVSPSTVSERTRTSCRHEEIERKGRNVEEDWRRNCSTPEFLLEVHQQNTLTLSFTTMNLCKGHTDQTSAKEVTPNSKLFHELDVNVSVLTGDVELNFSSLVDEGTKTDTIRTGPVDICGTDNCPNRKTLKV